MPAIKQKRKKSINMIGKQFGSLLVLKKSENSPPKHKKFVAKCVVCGFTYEYFGENIRRHGVKKVPGCKKCFKNATTHGMSGHPIFKTWEGMIARCYRNNHEAFGHYGGRGILVCDSWRNNPEAFITWATKHSWEKGLQVDRRNNDKGYSPENCRIVTPMVNGSNKRNNRWLILDGNHVTISQASKILGINITTIKARLDSGWSDEKACSPVKL